jgi:hypothetical protein
VENRKIVQQQQIKPKRKSVKREKKLDKKSISLKNEYDWRYYAGNEVWRNKIMWQLCKVSLIGVEMKFFSSDYHSLSDVTRSLLSEIINWM